MGTGPGGHSDTNEFEIYVGDVSILKCRSDWYVDGGSRNKGGDRCLLAIASPNLAVTFQDVPEFTDARVNGCPGDLMRWHGAVNHSTRLAFHDQANFCTGRGLAMGFFRKGCCLHHRTSGANCAAVPLWGLSVEANRAKCKVPIGSNDAEFVTCQGGCRRLDAT